MLGDYKEVFHLHALILPNERLISNPFSRSVSDLRFHFGVIPTEKFEDLDLSLDMRNLEYATKASTTCVELVYVGSLKLSTEALALIRECTAELFSNLFGDRCSTRRVTHA